MAKDKQFLSNKELLGFYEKIFLIRKFEEKVGNFMVPEK